MKQPYEMTRDEWLIEFEKTRIDGMPRYNSKGAGRSESIQKLSRMEFLLYGIGKWIYQKALDGDEWALECLDYGIYDRYDTIIKKYKEEQSI